MMTINREILDNQVHPVDQVSVVLRVTKDQEVFRVLLDLLVPLERMAFLDILENVDHQ